MHPKVSQTDHSVPRAPQTRESPAPGLSSETANKFPCRKLGSREKWLQQTETDGFTHNLPETLTSGLPPHASQWDGPAAAGSQRSTAGSGAHRIPNPMACIYAVAKKSLLLLDGKVEHSTVGFPTEPDQNNNDSSIFLLLREYSQMRACRPKTEHPDGLEKPSNSINHNQLDSIAFSLSQPRHIANQTASPTLAAPVLNFQTGFPPNFQLNPPYSDDSLGLPLSIPSNDSPAKVQSKGCNCKQSMCLKLYCPCFSSGGSCSPDCSCTECRNSSVYSELRNSVAKRIEELNPFAFRSRFATTENARAEIVSTRGCTCQRSQCAKYYCDCFKAGLKCSEICKCADCTNHKVSLVQEHVEKYRQKVERRRQKRTLYSVFGLQKKHRKGRIQKNHLS